VSGLSLETLDDYLWQGISGNLGFDIGANTGQNTGRMRSLFTRVIALEPAIESYATLADSWAGKPGVACLNVAASDRDGRLVLAERAGPMASGQLTPLNTAGFCSDWGPADCTRPVPCLTLDTLAGQYGNPDFVKIDTEGSEVLVLRGASRVLAEARPVLLTEFHSAALREECLRILGDAGYETETVRAPHLAEGSAFWAGYGWLRAVPR
jgi:FkbM family methyltransferase